MSTNLLEWNGRAEGILIIKNIRYMGIVCWVGLDFDLPNIVVGESALINQGVTWETVPDSVLKVPFYVLDL